MESFIEKVKSFFRETVLGNEAWEWAVGLAVAAVVFIVLASIKAAVVRVLRRRQESCDSKLCGDIADVFRRTSKLLLLYASLYVGSKFIDVTPKVDGILRSLLVVAALIQGGLWGSAILAHWIDRRMKSEESARSAASVMLGFTGKLVIWSLVLLLSLANLGVDITALIAGLGVGGIAVALAVQNILGDLFASISIALDKPFEIGDFIIVGDMMGCVEYVGLKTTRVRSLSGEQLIFSNADLLGSRIRNYKRMKERRIVFSVGVTYSTPREKVEAIPEMLKEIVKSQPQVRLDRAHFKQFGPYSLDFEIVYYVELADYGAYMDRQQAMNLAIMKKFQEEGVEFAFPTQTVIVEKQ